MAIPESQLQTWANPPSTITIVETHNAIRNALTNAGVQARVILQGSYPSHTNTYGTSDVDVLVISNIVEYTNKNNLNPLDLALVNSAYTPTYYSWLDHKNTVLSALNSQFGATHIEIGNKSFKLNKQGYSKADIVPCCLYRIYTGYQIGIGPLSFTGIQINENQTSLPIINFPEQHIANGEAKNKQTKQRYKPIVRIFKNGRDYLVQKGMIQQGIAASYFIECMLYNVPNNLFLDCSLQSTCESIGSWLHEQRENHSAMFFKCQNEILDLFGANSTSWDFNHFSQLLDAYDELWVTWGQVSNYASLRI